MMGIWDRIPVGRSFEQTWELPEVEDFVEILEKEAKSKALGPVAILGGPTEPRKQARKRAWEKRQQQL